MIPDSSSLLLSALSLFLISGPVASYPSTPQPPVPATPESEDALGASEDLESNENSPVPPENADSTEAPAGSTATGHPFSWPFVGWETMEPYGGTTRASRTETDPETRPAFTAIQEEGLSRHERDRRAILALAGDFRVSFDFIETASSADHYEPRRPYFSWATERAFILENQPDFISIQHLLVMEFVDDHGEVQGPFVMKHWRQDWTKGDTRILEFQGDRTWDSRAIEPGKHEWTQAVFQVDDSPRYETLGTWDHQGGLPTFRTRSFWRPLPRREFSVRDDYHVLAGHHEIIVTPTGWLHQQSNRKIRVEDGQIRKVLATELGAVRYERLLTPSLDAAESYWAATASYWKSLRDHWIELEKHHAPFTLHAQVDERPLFAHLFSLAGRLESGELTPESAIDEGRRRIVRFVINPDRRSGDFRTEE